MSVTTSRGGKGRNSFIEEKLRGLTYKEENILRLAIQPGHPANPWDSKEQLRNSMIIKILLGTGVRRAEFLNLRIQDIDFRQGAINIRRCANDSRLYESNDKPLSRRLRIKASMTELMQEYIMNDRRKHERAREHDFLAVSCQDGSPLSRSAYDHIFTAIRHGVRGIPLDFAGHLCRITWNDRFSDYCDLMGIEPVMERMIRCRIMGWVPDSRRAIFCTYTRRWAMMAGQEGFSIYRAGGLFDELTTDE